MLEVSELRAGYDQVSVLRNVSLEVDAGEIVCLLGANGAGKTTLLRTLSGVLKADGGSVQFKRNDITNMAPERIVRLGLSHVPEGREIFSKLTVDQNLRLGAYSGRMSRQDESATRRRIFGFFPVLEEKLQAPAGSLSGGQQQMLVVGRALMARPELLLLDEPSLGLAPQMVETIFRVVKQLRELGIPVLVVEQNASAVLSVADRGYLMETGSITAAGSARMLSSDDTIRRKYLGMD